MGKVFREEIWGENIFSCLLFQELVGSLTSFIPIQSFLRTLYQGIKNYNICITNIFKNSSIAICRSIESGLITAWQQRTWARMKEEYLNSGEERIVLPDDGAGGRKNN